MRFEKWTALGNDYVILEAEALPWEPTEARARRICDSHFGIGSDGVLLLSRSDDPDFVAELRIFNPDGSEAELSGNGAREAVLYLRRHGWTEADTFMIRTAAADPQEGDVGAGADLRARRGGDALLGHGRRRRRGHRLPARRASTTSASEWRSIPRPR